MTQLTNPVDLYTESIAGPLESAAGQLRRLASEQETANGHLRAQGGVLVSTLGGDIVEPFTQMIDGQRRLTRGVSDAIYSIAVLYDGCAQVVRDAARVVDAGPVGEYFDVMNWVLARVTPDLVIRDGESPIRAACDDLRSTVDRMTHDAGGFFSSLFHLDLGAALHYAGDEVAAIGHLAGDALAIIADVESMLCRWAVQVQTEFMRMLSNMEALVVQVGDALIGFTSLGYSAATIVDPNAASLEKALAGVDLGMTVAMLIPGGQEAILGRLAAKLGIKALADRLGARIAETVIAQMIKDLTARVASRAITTLIERDLAKKLTQDALQRIGPQLRTRLSGAVQRIIEDYLAGKISQKDARALIKSLQSAADRYTPDQLGQIASRFSADDLVQLARYKDVPVPKGWDIRPADNGQGIVYQRPGATGNADSVRIAYPTKQYPDGYLRYYNRLGQPLDANGSPGPNSATHIPLNQLNNAKGYQEWLKNV
jgi:hypothetical protein